MGLDKPEPRARQDSGCRSLLVFALLPGLSCFLYLLFPQLQLSVQAALLPLLTESSRGSVIAGWSRFGERAHGCLLQHIEDHPAAWSSETARDQLRDWVLEHQRVPPLLRAGFRSKSPYIRDFVASLYCPLRNSETFVVEPGSRSFVALDDPSIICGLLKAERRRFEQPSYTPMAALFSLAAQYPLEAHKAKDHLLAMASMKEQLYGSRLALLVLSSLPADDPDVFRSLILHSAPRFFDSELAQQCGVKVPDGPEPIAAQFLRGYPKTARPDRPPLKIALSQGASDTARFAALMSLQGDGNRHRRPTRRVLAAFKLRRILFLEILREGPVWQRVLLLKALLRTAWTAESSQSLLVEFAQGQQPKVIQDLVAKALAISVFRAAKSGNEARTNALLKPLLRLPGPAGQGFRRSLYSDFEEEWKTLLKPSLKRELERVWADDLASEPPP